MPHNLSLNRLRFKEFVRHNEAIRIFGYSALIDSGRFSGQVMNDTVILFHGIARTKKSMEKLAVFLSGNGYRVVNVVSPGWALRKLTQDMIGSR
jgi:alpha-beta hydrolase superfamily lysophospholipase